jgi:hypothetical protein
LGDFCLHEVRTRFDGIPSLGSKATGGTDTLASRLLIDLPYKEKNPIKSLSIQS